MSNREDEITAWFADQRKLDQGTVPIGIGDDMAMINVSGGQVLITTDMLLDGVHFDLTQASIEQVGYKAMAVNLSDCAAMASEPLGAVVSVGLPKAFKAEQLKQLHCGILKASDEYNCPLVGGDITSWKNNGAFAISVAMLSRPTASGPVKRSGAKIGDLICVTGQLGGSGEGKHLEFAPRVFEAIKMAAMVELHSMMDISDGLSSDLGRICKSSGVGAVIFEDKIPVSVAAKNKKDPVVSALNEGEDFELLFTLGPEQYSMLTEKWDAELTITLVGEVVEGSDINIVTSQGEKILLESQGYDHLAG